MALHCSIQNDILEIRSVGDQELDVGLAQLDAGMELADEVYKKNGNGVDLLLDLVESEESKSTADLKAIASYFSARCPPLSGRIAIVAPEDFLYGLSRVFSAWADPNKLDTSVFRSHAEAWAWLLREAAPGSVDE